MDTKCKVTVTKSSFTKKILVLFHHCLKFSVEHPLYGVHVAVVAHEAEAVVASTAHSLLMGRYNFASDAAEPLSFECRAFSLHTLVRAVLLLVSPPRRSVQLPSSLGPPSNSAFSLITVCFHPVDYIIRLQYL